MTLYCFFKELLGDFLKTYFTVLKLIVPVILILKVISYTPLIAWLGVLLAPVMTILGLPGDAGIVVATTLSTSIYAGMISWSVLPGLTPLTVAQATTLAGIMLVAHTFPLELQVTYKAGLKRRYVFLWRVLGAFLFGYCVHFICHNFHLFQNKAHVIFTPTHTDLTIWDWAITQGQTLLKIAAVIFLLIVMMKVFRILKITQALEKILRPLLGKIGISNSVIPLTIIGLVLGLVYGGALIINEAKQGDLNPKDILFSLALLNLCHSLFEDSMLGAVMGGNFWVLLIARFVFSYGAVFLLFAAIKNKPEIVKRFLSHSPLEKLQ